MEKLNKYSLHFLSAYAVIIVIFAAFNWQSLTMLQKCVVVATVIIVLHEWEEQRFPGGFYEMLSGVMKIDRTTVDFHAIYSIPDTLIFSITALALIFSNVQFFACAVIIFGIFEGLIHVMGIKLAKLKKPYTPGMITGEIYAISSIISIILLCQQDNVSVWSWLLGFLWLIVCLVIMELSVWKVVGLGPKDVKRKMQENIKNL